MKKAFTLVEILIVVTILGILAAIALPTFQGHIIQAKEAAAKDNLRILRNAIELYAAQHNDMPPGYINGDLENPLNAWFVSNQFTTTILILILLSTHHYNSRTKEPWCFTSRHLLNGRRHKC